MANNITTTEPTTQLNKCNIIKIKDFNEHKHNVDFSGLEAVLSLSIESVSSTAYHTLYPSNWYKCTVDTKAVMSGYGYNFSLIKLEFGIKDNNGNIIQTDSINVKGSNYSYDATYTGSYFIKKGTYIRLLTIRTGSAAATLYKVVYKSSIDIKPKSN